MSEDTYKAKAIVQFLLSRHYGFKEACLKARIQVLFAFDHSLQTFTISFTRIILEANAKRTTLIDR